MNKKVKNIIQCIYDKLFRICVSLFRYLPVNKHKIVLSHDFGNGYGDSPKYIAEELLRRNKPYTIVWLVNKHDMEIPQRIRKAHISRIRSIYELSTAKVIVTTLKARFNFEKKPSQYFIYTPHGQIGAKYVEGQAKNLGQGYIDGSKWHSKMSDLFLSSSKLFTEEVRNYYWYDGEIQECGLPRNDIFFNSKQEDIVGIKDKLSISADTKVLLYAPTFRNEGGTDVYDISTDMLISTLEKQTHGKWVILIRMHPCHIWYGKYPFAYSDKVIDVTDYPDMQELLLVSDILISDYSSTMFDFYLMRKPVFLYTKDIPEYQKMRGLKDWFFKVPFPFCHDNDELKKAIEEFDKDKYQKSLVEFDKIYGSMENGTATKVLTDRICQVMGR